MAIENYLDDLPANIDKEKAAHLELMSRFGSSAERQIEESGSAASALAAAREAETYARGAAIGQPKAGIEELNAEQARLLGGQTAARDQLSVDHQAEMDRISLANLAYKDQLSEASVLHKQRMDKELAALKLAMSGGGGRGGGGYGGSGYSGGGYAPVVDPNSVDTGMESLDGIMLAAAESLAASGAGEYAIGSLLDSLDRNPDAAIAAAGAFDAGVAAGADWSDLSVALRGAMEAEGYNPVDSFNIIEAASRFNRPENMPGYAFAPPTQGGDGSGLTSLFEERGHTVNVPKENNMWEALKAAAETNVPKTTSSSSGGLKNLGPSSSAKKTSSKKTNAGNFR